MLLVDAYNVLHATPALREVLEGQGQKAACWALVELLARWREAHPRPPEVVLVFDGAPPLPRGPRVSGLQVRFQDHADDDLKLLLERAGQHTLVSADGELVRHAAWLGQRVIAPGDFVGEIEVELEAYAELSARDPGPLSEAEVQGWLEAFGGASAAGGAGPAGAAAQGSAPAAGSPPTSGSPGPGPVLSPDEVQDWLDYFGA